MREEKRNWSGEKWRWRLRVAGLLGQRGLRAGLMAVSMPLVLTVALLVAAAYIAFNLSQLADEGILMVAHPLIYPFFLGVTLLAAYTALASVLALARERDRGTLEVLFYGPVDEPAYILGKFLEQLLFFAFLLILVTIFIALAAAVLQLAISPRFGQVIPLALFVAAGVIAFGILLAQLTRRTLSAVLLFLGVFAFFTGVQWLVSRMSNTNFEEVTASLAFLVKTVTWLGRVVSWLNPFTYLNHGLLAVELGSSGLYLVTLGQALLYTLVLLGISTYLLTRKGVRR